MKHQAFVSATAMIGVVLFTARMNAQSDPIIEFRAGSASLFAQVSCHTINKHGIANPIIFTKPRVSAMQRSFAQGTSMPIAIDTCRSMTFGLNLRAHGDGVHPWRHEFLRASIEIVDAQTGKVLAGNAFACMLVASEPMNPGIDTSASCTFTLSTSTLTSKRIQLRLVVSSYLYPVDIRVSNIADDDARARSSRTNVH